MIVLRAFNVLDGITVQFSAHVTCCGTGTCPEPDEVTYRSHSHDPYEVGGVAPVLEGIVHEWFSDAGGDLLSAFLENHSNGSAYA